MFTALPFRQLPPIWMPSRRSPMRPPIPEVSSKVVKKNQTKRNETRLSRQQQLPVIAVIVLGLYVTLGTFRTSIYYLCVYRVTATATATPASTTRRSSIWFYTFHAYFHSVESNRLVLLQLTHFSFSLFIFIYWTPHARLLLYLFLFFILFLWLCNVDSPGRAGIDWAGDGTWICHVVWADRQTERTNNWRSKTTRQVVFILRI